MAIRHISTIFCDYLIRADDGRLTFAGTFRNLKWNRFPVFKQMALAVEFDGDGGEAFRVSLEGNGLDLTLAEGNVTVPEGMQEYQRWGITVAGVIGLRIEQAGVYEAILRENGEIVHTTQLGLLHVEEAENNEVEQEEAQNVE